MGEKVGTPPGGEVTVTLVADGDHALLEVRDTGVGIAPEDVTRLFERFYRTEDAHRARVPGLGLGLSICQAIAEQHGGSIQARSEVGVGTVMAVRLPLGGPVGVPRGRAASVARLR